MTRFHDFKRLSPLLFLVFIDSFSYFVVIPVLLQLFFNDHYGLLPSSTSHLTRNFLTGATIVLSTFAGIVAAPFIGSLSDKWGRKKTLLLSLSGILVGFYLPIVGIQHKSLTLVLLGRFLGGVGSASQPVAQAAIADLCEGKDKAFFLSLVGFMMTVAMIVGPLVGGYLSDHQWVALFNATTPYRVAFLMSALNFVLILFFFKETLQAKRQVSILSVKDMVLGFKKMAKQYQIIRLLLVFLFLEIAWSQYYQSISLYLHQQYNYSVQSVGLFGAYMGVIMSIGLLALYPLFLRHFSVAQILRYSLVFNCVGLLGCAIWPAAISQWIFIVPVAVFTGTAYVSLLTNISHRVAMQHQGWVMGYTSTTLYIAWLLTGFNSGLLISWHATSPLYVALFFGLIAFLFNAQEKT